MALPHNPHFIPLKRRGVENLLESVDGDVSLLTADQISAIRRLYFLDPPESEMTVADLLTAGLIQP